ncbi:protein FAM170A-like [Cynocephalus volans]|uniref:protein FAM170A-like n=1 Tax=Cynocephalus volans TaxID=110931 RepID=UPI002FCCA44F
MHAGSGLHVSTSAAAAGTRAVAHRQVAHAGIIDSDENTLQPGPSGLTQAHSQTAEDSDSKYLSSASFEDKLDYNESCKSQENAPEISVVVPAQDQEAGENSAASEHLSCVSSARIHQLPQDVSCLGSSEMSQPQDLEQRETYSPLPHISVHSYLTNMPFMSSEHKEKKRAMKIYYVHVPTKRGVAVLSDTEEGLEPPQKKTRVEEMTFPENISTKTTISDTSTKELFTDSECSVDSKAQEERKEEADSPAEPPAPEESSRARTPEMLDSGFKCMACCWSYPSLEVLEVHVEHGVHEGCSCRTCHLALARLKNKRNGKGKKNEIKTTTSVCNREEHIDVETSSYTSTD